MVQVNVEAELRRLVDELKQGLETIAAFPAPDPARDIAKATLAKVHEVRRKTHAVRESAPCEDFKLRPERFPTPGDVCRKCGFGWAVHPKRGAEASPTV